MMRLRLIGLGQMERCMCRKLEVNPYLIAPLHLLSSMEGGITLWYGLEWCGKIDRG